MSAAAPDPSQRPSANPSDLSASSVEPSGSADDAFLLAWLRDRDVPCPLCRYNLRNLATGRCPECGNEVRLGVSMKEPFMAAWTALLVALLLPAGLGIILIAIWSYAALHSGRLGLGALSVGPTEILTHLILSVPLSIVAVAGRRRFMRWSRRVQIATASAAWLAILITVLTILAVINY